MVPPSVTCNSLDVQGCGSVFLRLLGLDKILQIIFCTQIPSEQHGPVKDKENYQLVSI